MILLAYVLGFIGGFLARTGVNEQNMMLVAIALMFVYASGLIVGRSWK